MRFGPFIGRSPEAWDDQCMDRLDSSVEGYLVAEADGGNPGRGGSTDRTAILLTESRLLRLRNAPQAWHIVRRERPEDEAVMS